MKGLVKELEYEMDKFNYTSYHTYLPDFKIVTKNGKTIFIETKGNGRSFDHTVRNKMINVRDQNPEIDLRIVFYSDGKIGPKRKDGSYFYGSVDTSYPVSLGFHFENRPLDIDEQ